MKSQQPFQETKHQSHGKAPKQPWETAQPGIRRGSHRILRRRGEEKRQDHSNNESNL